MKHCISHYVLLFTLFMLISVKSFSQKDSIWVKLTYNYRLENGQRTSEKTVISQKSYTLDWKLLRELKLDAKTGNISSYVVYFYNTNDKLISAEEFSIKDSIISGEKYSYDLQGRVNEIKYFGSSAATVPVLEKREVIAYLKDTLKKSVTAYAPQKKKLYVTTYRYDTGNNTVQRISAFKVPENGISKVTETQKMDNGKVTEILRITRYADKNTVTEKKIFEYNDKNQLVVQKAYNGNIMVSATNYKYFANNKLHVIEETVDNGIVLSYKTLDYNIHFINLGSNKSYLK
ncbi:MAG: hypothetical protein R6W78_04905 [Bacteroidales bacterium]